MESSRRAVEAYRRTRLIDGVTADDDKVAPVYKLDEIAGLLQSSHQPVVHELVEYIFRRLDHKSPIVKQKTLRLVKFVAGKAGPDFKREVQRQSAAIRQLFHYKGQPDPLKGDSLNKAVRDTAHEAIAALFAEEKAPALDEVSRRIQGFGSTNFDGRPPAVAQEKKTLLSEVVDLGASSIKQGLTIISNHYNQYNANGVKSSASNGSYEAPNFRRSLGDRDTYRDSYRESRDSYSGSRGSYSEHRLSSESQSYAEPEAPKDEEEPREVEDLTFEDKLLSSLTPVGGVRLHPNREGVQSFLSEAQKSNPERLFLAFEQRLQLHSWQVRLKTLCFLEAALHHNDTKPFGELAKLFQENPSVVVDCTESPQNSLREKAKKVLQMLTNAEPSSSTPTAAQAKTAQADLPDLMDTADVAPKVDTSGLDLLAELSLTSEHSSTAPITSEGCSENPFAGMSIHGSPKHTVQLDAQKAKVNGDGSSLFEGLSVSQDEQPVQQQDALSLIADLLSGLSTDDKDTQQSSSSSFLTTSPLGSKPEASPAAPPLSFLQQQQQQQQLQFQQQQPQMMYRNSLVAPLLPGMVQQQAFAAAHFPGLMAAPFGQQQQQQQQGFAGFAQAFPGTGFDFASNPFASTAGVTARKEETKAFDFIADHLAAARK